jgi:hypothetical protein
MLGVQSSVVAKQMIEMSIADSRSRLEFLEGELRKMSMEQAPLASSAYGSNFSIAPVGYSNPPNSRFGINETYLQTLSATEHRFLLNSLSFAWMKSQ